MEKSPAALQMLPGIFLFSEANRSEVLIAMAAAPLLDRRNYGSGNVAFGRNAYDNIEKYGTQGKFKGLTGKYSELPPDISAKASESALGLDDAAQEGTQDAGGLYVSDRQFGKKVGKHAEDFGLDASQPASRDLVRNKVDDIYKNPAEIREGVFRGQGEILPNGGNASGKVKFFIQGNDVVATDIRDSFINIIKDGVNNPRVKSAMKIWP